MPPDQNAIDGYVQAEITLYDSYYDAVKTEQAARVRNKARQWLRRTRALANWLVQEGVSIPINRLTPYSATQAERIAAGIEVKYQIRGYNVLRDLARVQSACPELLQKGADPQTVLDPSSGGCGLYEALTDWGHQVTCRDFFPDTGQSHHGNAYALIHDALSLDVAHFDGRDRPYDLPTASQDHVFCFQAIDAYAPNGDWSEAVQELLRVARKSLVLVFNPIGTPEQFNKAMFNLLYGFGGPSPLLRTFKCTDTGLPGLRIDKM